VSTSDRLKSDTRHDAPEQTTRRQLLKRAAASAATIGAATAIHSEASASPSPNTRTADLLAQEVTLKLNGRTGPEQEMFEKLIATFAETHPEIKIEGEYFAGANQEYFQKVAVLFAGGNPGDLVWLSSLEGYYDYAARDSLYAVDDFITKDAIDGSEWYPAAWDMMEVEGKRYGLPLWSHPSIVGLYYNQDLLDEAGVGIPDETWDTDKLASAAESLTKLSGRTYEQMGYYPATQFFNGLSQVIPSFGGQVLSDDGKTITIDTPEAKAALQWLQDLFVKSKVSPPPGQQDIGQIMSSGKGAMRSGGYWDRWAAETTWEFNWGMAPMPKGPAGTNGAMLQTDAFAISAGTQYAEAAWEFEKIATSHEAGMILWDSNYIPGSRPDVWEDPSVMENKIHAIWIKAMQEAAPLRYPANYRLREFEIAMDQVLGNLWLGNRSVDEAVAEATTTGQEILDKPIS
jgi:multiple sugar transport system substrate-binding protein